MGEYCVKRGKELVAIYNGASDEKNRWMAETAAKSGSYGPGCTVEPYTPPAKDENEDEPSAEDDEDQP